MNLFKNISGKDLSNLRLPYSTGTHSPIITKPKNIYIQLEFL